MEPRSCPACLAPSTVGQVSCASCRAPLIVGERFVVPEPLAPRGSARTTVDDAALVAVGPSNKPVVILQSKLAVEHAPPRWVLATRLAILAATAFVVPASGVALAVLMAAIWIVSGFVVRYPVRLAPGHAMFLGGLDHTARPGVHWLRRRWGDEACSIPLAPLRLDWRPAPTRLEQGEHHAWLELELELWVAPRADEVGQFIALLNYQQWQANPRHAAKKLREEVLDAVVEHVQDERSIERACVGPVRLDARAQEAIDRGLHALGLERLQRGKHSIVLRPRTEDLSGEDRLWIEQRAPSGG